MLFVSYKFALVLNRIITAKDITAEEVVGVVTVGVYGSVVVVLREPLAVVVLEQEQEDPVLEVEQLAQVQLPGLELELGPMQEVVLVPVEEVVLGQLLPAVEGGQAALLFLLQVEDASKEAGAPTFFIPVFPV